MALAGAAVLAARGRAVPVRLRQPGLLLAVGQRPPGADERGPAGARVAAATRPRPSALKAELALSQRIRDFAVTELKLPDNPSYRRYADLHRPRRGLERGGGAGLFADAQDLVLPGHGLRRLPGLLRRGRGPRRGGRAERRRASRRVVYPVPAYSTLGWMNWAGGDPLLSTPSSTIPKASWRA